MLAALLSMKQGDTKRESPCAQRVADARCLRIRAASRWRAGAGSAVRYLMRLFYPMPEARLKPRWWYHQRSLRER